jgi:hypothetical protein
MSLIFEISRWRAEPWAVAAVCARTCSICMVSFTESQSRNAALPRLPCTLIAARAWLVLATPHDQCHQCGRGCNCQLQALHSAGMWTSVAVCCVPGAPVVAARCPDAATAAAIARSAPQSHHTRRLASCVCQPHSAAQGHACRRAPAALAAAATCDHPWPQVGRRNVSVRSVPLHSSNSNRQQAAANTQQHTTRAQKKNKTNI